MSLLLLYYLDVVIYGVHAPAKPLVGCFEELLNSLNKATEATGEVQDDPEKHNL